MPALPGSVVPAQARRQAGALPAVRKKTVEPLEAMSDKYILVNGVPTPEPDLLKWGRWFETADAERIVAKTTVGDTRVSTIFLGLDHRWGSGPPVLWETMIFGGSHDGWQERYTSQEEAIRRHNEIVGQLQSGDVLDG